MFVVYVSEREAIFFPNSYSIEVNWLLLCVHTNRNLPAGACAYTYRKPRAPNKIIKTGRHQNQSREEEKIRESDGLKLNVSVHDSNSTLCVNNVLYALPFKKNVFFFRNVNRFYSFYINIGFASFGTKVNTDNSLRFSDKKCLYIRK